MNYLLLLTTSFIFGVSSNFVQASFLNDESSSSSASVVQKQYTSDFEQMYARDYVEVNRDSLARLNSKNGLEKDQFKALMGSVPGMVNAANLLFDSKPIDAIRYLVWAFQESIISSRILPVDFLDTLEKFETKIKKLDANDKIGGYKKNQLKKYLNAIIFVLKQINGKDRGDSMLLFAAAYANPQYANFEKYLSREERKSKKLLFAHIAFDLGKASSIPDENDEQFKCKQGLSALEQLANDPSKPSYERVDAQNTLAEFFDKKGNKEKADFYGKMAAEGGDPRAQRVWVQRVLQGDRKSFDDLKQARFYLSCAVQNNDFDALYHLAIMEAAGLGGDENLPEARRRFKIIADIDIRKIISTPFYDVNSNQFFDQKMISTHNLAIMFLYGEGGEIDQKEAFRYFDKAAKKGFLNSKLYLAQMLYDGSGCDADLKRASVMINELLVNNKISSSLRSSALAEQARQQKSWDDVHVHLSDAVFLGGGDELQDQIDNLKKTFDSDNSGDSDDPDLSPSDSSGDEGEDNDSFGILLLPAEKYVSSSSLGTVWPNKRTKDQKKEHQSKRRLMKFLEEHKEYPKKSSEKLVILEDLKFQFAGDHEKNSFQKLLKGDNQNSKALNKILTDMIDNTFETNIGQAHSVGKYRGQSGAISRKLTKEDRFVYKVIGRGEILVLDFQGHYGDKNKDRKPNIHTDNTVFGSMSEFLKPLASEGGQGNENNPGNLAGLHLGDKSIF